MKFKVGNIFIEKKDCTKEYLIVHSYGGDIYDISRVNSTESWKKYNYNETDYKIIRNIKKVSMSLKIIPNTLKRILNDNLQAQYKAGYRNGDLALTEEGKNELMEILASEFDAKLTEAATGKINEEDKNK